MFLGFFSLLYLKVFDSIRHYFMPILNVCFCLSLYAINSVLSWLLSKSQTNNRKNFILYCLERNIFRCSPRIYPRTTSFRYIYFFSMLMIGNNAEEVVSIKNYFRIFLGETWKLTSIEVTCLWVFMKCLTLKYLGEFFSFRKAIKDKRSQEFKVWKIYKHNLPESHISYTSTKLVFLKASLAMIIRPLNMKATFKYLLLKYIKWQVEYLLKLLM